MVKYKGWATNGDTKDSVARFNDPILHAYGINFYSIEPEKGVSEISLSF